MREECRQVIDSRAQNGFNFAVNLIKKEMTLKTMPKGVQDASVLSMGFLATTDDRTR